MSIGLGIFIIIAIVVIMIDYTRLLLRNRELEPLAEIEAQFIPTCNIMVGAGGDSCIQELAMMCAKAHQDAGIGIRITGGSETDGYVMTVFDNGDQLIVYNYEKAQIEELSDFHKRNFAQKVFFDYKLPEGAIRATIEQLGLLDHVVNIGICRDKKEK